MARLSVRRLLPPTPAEPVVAELNSIGASPSAIADVARYAAVEALAIGGMRSDELRVLQRAAAERGAKLVEGKDELCVVMGPLSAVADLPNALHEWGQGTEELAAAIADLLTRVD
jgi:hypothetical protein